jgi:hypothetical protein
MSRKRTPMTKKQRNELRRACRTLFARCEFTYQRTEKVYTSRRERDGADWEAQVEQN